MILEKVKLTSRRIVYRTHSNNLIENSEKCQKTLNERVEDDSFQIMKIVLENAKEIS